MGLQHYAYWLPTELNCTCGMWGKGVCGMNESREDNIEQWNFQYGKALLWEIEDVEMKKEIKRFLILKPYLNGTRLFLVHLSTVEILFPKSKWCDSLYTIRSVIFNINYEIDLFEYYISFSNSDTLWEN